MQALGFGFNEVHTIADVAVIGGLGLAYLNYRRDRKNDLIDRAQAREHMVQEAAAMHAENKQRLETVVDFTKAQDAINKRRDSQIYELMIHTAKLTEIAQGINRRVEMLESNKH